MAAAELLAGAGRPRHAVRSCAERARKRARCGAWASTLELGGHITDTFTSADLVVLSPGVPPEQPRGRGRARARRAGDR